MRRWETTTGRYVTADTRAAAAALAREYGLGELVRTVPAPNRRPMTLRRAIRMRTLAEEHPRLGAGWPENSLEREAERLLREHGVEI